MVCSLVQTLNYRPASSRHLNHLARRGFTQGSTDKLERGSSWDRA